MNQGDLTLLKLNLQEQPNDVFTDQDLQTLLSTHNNVWLASYHGCCIKATANADLELPGGLKLAGNSEYWMKLAEVYYAHYEEDKLNGDTGDSERPPGINSAGYKNSMQRIDEFPPKRFW